MNLKQMLMIVLFITVSFTVITAGVMALVVYKPEMVGFGNKQPKQVKVNILKKSNKDNRYSGNKTNQKNGNNAQNNTNRQQPAPNEKRLMDSLSNMKKSYAGTQGALNKMKDSLAKSEQRFAALNDSLRKLTALYLKADKELKSIKSREMAINAQAAPLSPKERDSVNTTNLKRFASIYDNSSADAVAKILNQISTHDAASILKLMQKKKAGKVLEAMTPEQAANIMNSGLRK